MYADLPIQPLPRCRLWAAVWLEVLGFYRLQHGHSFAEGGKATIRLTVSVRSYSRSIYIIVSLLSYLIRHKPT